MGLKPELDFTIVDWLLEKENPSIRYYTLTELLGKSADESQVVEAKVAIMEEGVVPNILSKQNNNGTWETPTTYTAKYRGTVWQLIILAQLGANGADSRIKKACEFILENSRHNQSGAFSMVHAAKTSGGRGSEVIPCLTGNMIFSLVRLGYLDDARIQTGIDWINTYQRFDDAEGTGAPAGWPYDKHEMCWGKHTCHMGAAKALKALAEIPLEKRDNKTEATLKAGTEYFLKHHIYKCSHDLSKVSKPGWRHFSFPLMYQTDALEMLGILAKLGCKDQRMQDAADLVLSKQNSIGRWTLENTFNGRFQEDIEVKNATSKWITLKALTALKRFYS